MLNLLATAKTAIAAAGLAAGALSVGAAAAQAAPYVQHGAHAQHNNPLAACQKWAKDHTFVWIVKAAGSPKRGLTVTGDMIRVHCGGPDDLQYIVTSKHFTGHLLPGAKIDVLVFGKNGPESARLPESKFPHWVATDHSGNRYEVAGPFRAIRGLLELYHP